MCNRTQFPQNHRERETQKDFTSLPLCPGSASVMRVCQEGWMELSKEARLWKGTGLDFSCPMFSMAITFLCVLCFCRMTLWVGGGGGGSQPEHCLIYLEHLASFPGVSNNKLNHGRDHWERIEKETEEFPSLLLHYQNRTFQWCRIIRLAL